MPQAVEEERAVGQPGVSASWVARCSSAASSPLRAVMSAETPTTPTSRPSASRIGASVTWAGKVVPSRRRAVNSPDQGSPARSRAQVAAVAAGSRGPTVSSPTGRPVASARDQP